MATRVGVQGNVAQPGSSQINNVSFAAHTSDEIDRKCLRALRCPDTLVVKNRLKENKDKLLQGPIEWILRDPQYTRWKDGNDVCLLWIRGGAGKGKTMASIGLIERLLQEDSAVVTYFFCQNADYELNTVDAIIKGLILRLIKQQKELGEPLRSRWDAENNHFNDNDTSWRTLWDVLLEMLEILNRHKYRVYLIVDALDECQGEGMASFLKVVVRTGLINHSTVKWLLTSRPLDSAERELLAGHEQVLVSLELNSKKISEAVKEYIASKVAELANRNRYGETLRRRLEVELRGKAEGTYLWVSLVCKRLECIHRDDVLATIQSLPPGLYSFYDRILKELSEAEPADAKRCLRLLKVMLLAYRPLSILEVDSVIGLPNDSMSTKASIDQCASLIRMQGTTIEFVHQSARDYLAKEGGQPLLDLHGHYGNGEIALSCVAYMSELLKVNLAELPYPDSTSKSVRILRGNERNALLASLDYAAALWVRHLEQGKRSKVVHNALTGQGEVSVFLQTKFLEWLECLSLLGKLSLAQGCIRKLRKTVDQSETFLSAFLPVASNFLSQHYYTAREWPLQIYSSVIVFESEAHIAREFLMAKVPRWMEKHRLPAIGPALPLKTEESPVDTPIADWHRLFARSKNMFTYPNLLSTPQMVIGFIRQFIDELDDPEGRIFRFKIQKVVDEAYHALQSDGNLSVPFALFSKLPVLVGCRDWIITVAFPPDGDLIASGSDDRAIRLWDARTGALWKTLTGHTGWILALAYSPDGNLIASGSGDRTIMLWSTKTGALQKTLRGHTDWVMTLAFSADGNLIASGTSAGAVGLWDIETGESQITLPGYTGSVSAIAFSPDGTLIATGSIDKTVRLWDVARHLGTPGLFGGVAGCPLKPYVSHPIKTADNISKIYFSPNGQYLMTNLGAMKIGENGLTDPQGLDSGSLTELWVSGRWIRYGEARIFRLGLSFTETCYDVRGDHVIIGSHDGRILSLVFDRRILHSTLARS